MQSNQNIFGWTPKEDQVWLVDQYRMSQIKLKNFAIRDQAFESYGKMGKSKTYFWQHKSKDHCTIKVHAIVTDSNLLAHKVMKQFMSSMTIPSAFKKLDHSILASQWFEETGAEKVRFVSVGNKQHTVILVWGNVFFHIESIGEQDHPITDFLRELGDNWVTLRSDKNDTLDFGMEAKSDDVKPGDEIILHRYGPQALQEYSTFVYIAGPKGLVTLHRKEGTVRLKIKKHFMEAESTTDPYAVLIGVRSDGGYKSTQRTYFSIQK